MTTTGTLRRRRKLLIATAIAVVVSFLVPGVAGARKPIISYLQGGQVHFYDAQLGTELAPVDVSPGASRFGVSLNGRFVLSNDAQNDLHLFDRATGQQVPLPGIDVYNNPAFLTASSFGLLAFDNNVNGPAVVYDSSKGQFVPTGFPANNGHRQPILSGTGLSLATTCSMNCVVDLGTDSNPYVQNLQTMTDTGVPDNPNQDEEDPCINWRGTLVGWDGGVPTANDQKDITLYNATKRAYVQVPGLNNGMLDDTHCVLDGPGDYIAFARQNDNTLKLYSRATAQLVPIPNQIKPPANFPSSALLSEPTCAGLFVTDVGSQGRDVIKGTPGNDVIETFEGQDTVKGLGGNDVICGGDGRDRLFGGRGRDTLLGERGGDKLVGGPGKDKLIGGPGKDIRIK
jgi:Ca2+-binding RTX toxin-like protein